MRLPKPTVHHQHFLKPGKLFSKHSADDTVQKDSSPVNKQDNLSLRTALSTDQLPLLRQESAPSISNQSESPLVSANLPFTEKYGRCHHIVHYGAHSTTRLHSRDKQLFAIKVYRRPIVERKPQCAYHSTSIHPSHPNILPILDLLYNERGEFCVVMPYCAGGDLNSLLAHNSPLPTQEADCIITQILRALAFLHAHNTAHRDVRLETVLLTARGAVKLAGFGDGHIRRIWEESCALGPAESETLPPQPQHPPQGAWSFPLLWTLSSFCRNFDYFSRDDGHTIAANSSTPSFMGMSRPYIPPEGFRNKGHSPSYCQNYGGHYTAYDPRPADVWATAMVYMALVNDHLLWRSACPNQEDGRYLEYLHSRCEQDGYPPIESLGQVRVCDIGVTQHKHYIGLVSDF